VEGVGNSGEVLVEEEEELEGALEEEEEEGIAENGDRSKCRGRSWSRRSERFIQKK